MNYFGDSSEADRAPGLSEVHEPRAGVGTLLRATRLRLGQELEDIAAILRIRLSYLQALEAGDAKALPGTTYAIGFVRAYADYLGLDSSEVVRRFKAEVNANQHRTELVFPAPVPDSGIPRGAVLLMALVIAGAAYGGWYYLSSVDKRVVDLVSEPSGRLMSLLDRTGPSTPAPAPDRTAAVAAEAAPAERIATVRAPAGRESAGREPVAWVAGAEIVTPAPTVPGPVAPLPVSDSAAVATPETRSLGSPSPEAPAIDALGAGAEEPAPAERPEPAASVSSITVSDVPAAVPAEGESEVASLSRPGEAAAAVPAQATPAGEPAGVGAIPPAPAASAVDLADAGQTFGVAEDRARIVLRARDDAWVQVRDSDNGLVLTRMLRAGDIYRVPPREGLRLITGNAGALEVLVDGKVTPPLGAMGMVRRDVPLDADRLLAGVATN